MRTFLAIELPQKVKDSLQSQFEKLYQQYPDIRWVSPENFHVTLYFLGEIDSPEGAIKKIGEAIYDIPRFHLYSSKAGVFIKHKITLYLGFQRNKILERLVDAVREKFQLPTDKKFVPHLTIGRYRIPSKQQYLLMKKKLKNLQADIDFEIDKIILFESILESQKPVYKKLAEFALLEKP